MENQNEPLLFRPFRTPKTNTKKNFCPLSFPTIGASTRLYSVDFSCDFSNFAQFTQNLLNTAKIDMIGTWKASIGSIYLSLASPALSFV